MTMRMNQTNSSSSLLFPLDQFYADDHCAFPVIEPIDGDVMPQPYQQLLVHAGDMTPTLEQYHGSRISLNLFSRKLDGELFSRRVALVLDSNDTVVEFGAITIHLDQFSPEARQHVLECKRPLGTILNEDMITHSSRPVGYFRVMSDQMINETLELTQPQWLYGRQNVHYGANEKPLAQVIEILPPLTTPAG